MQILLSIILGIAAGLSIWLLVKLVGELLTRPPARGAPHAEYRNGDALDQPA
jgi:hypothetical protein